jgi:hypothetical protein
MRLNRLLAIIGGLLLLAYAGERTKAQNEAPFSIRYPPDGATVREKVPIKIPAASIPFGGYVSIYIDGNFRAALSPTLTEAQRRKPGAMFEYVWDTKQPYLVPGTNREEPPGDGEHEITARLYTPSAAEQSGSALAATSSVRVTVANKAKADPGPLRLRYRFVDGDNRTYIRTGETKIVGGLGQGSQGVGDQEVVAQKSELLLAVEDKYPDGSAIVRNKIKKLTVRQGGQQFEFPSYQLPVSLYQQLTPDGRVVYQDSPTSFFQFAQLGIPVNTTIDLPVLPKGSVKIGDKWRTHNVVLDIPGTPPDQMPRETVESTFEGIEWQGGYPTAKIRQTFQGKPKTKTITFGNILIQDPTIKFEREIYLAYGAGILVKINRNLEISGQTSAGITGYGGPAGMMGPMGPGMLPPDLDMMAPGMVPGMAPGMVPGGTRARTLAPRTGRGGASRRDQDEIAEMLSMGPMGPGMMPGARTRTGRRTALPGTFGLPGVAGRTAVPGAMTPGMVGRMPTTGATRGPIQGREQTRLITLKSTTVTELTNPKTAAR